MSAGEVGRRGERLAAERLVRPRRHVAAELGQQRDALAAQREAVGDAAQLRPRLAEEQHGARVVAGQRERQVRRAVAAAAPGSAAVPHVLGAEPDRVGVERVSDGRCTCAVGRFGRQHGAERGGCDERHMTFAERQRRSQSVR